MKISVIVPIFNIRQYLSTCINSLLGQTYNNIEVILLDDGSTDGSEDLCDEFASKDSRISVIHKSNSGVSDSRNIGISLATGDYICFVDGDDFIQREYFEKAVTILKKYTPKILINTYKLYYDNDNVIDTFIKDKNIKLSKNEFLKGIFEGKKYNWSPFCKFFHSSITHLLKFNKEYCFGEDLLFIYDLIIKLSSSDVIVYSPLSCYMYVQRNTSACYSYPVEKRYDCIKIYEYIINTSDKDVSEYVYLNLYLTYLIKLKFHMLQCNYDVRSNYYIKCCSEPKKNFFKNICNPRMKFKSRILILLNCLPNFIFKRIMLVALTKKYKCF